MALGAGVERSYTINLVGNDKASSAFRSVQSSASRTQRVMDKLTKAMKYAAIAAGAALAAAAVLAAKAMWDATKAAMAEQESIVKLRGQLIRATGATRRQTKAVEDWITAQQNATGIADDELRPALATLVRYTEDLSSGQRLLKTAMDISAATGKDLSTVSLALGKAYDGNTSSLSRLGLKIKDASGETLTFGQIMDSAREKMGGAAREAGRTAAGQWRILQARLEDVKEEVGKALLPVFRRLVRWAGSTLVPWLENEFVPAFRRFTKWIRSEAVPYIKNELIPALRGMWSWLKEKVWPSVRDVWNAVADLIGQLKGLFASIDEGRDASAGFTKFLNAATLNLRIFLGVVDAVVSSLGWMIDKLTWMIDNARTIADTIGNIASLPGTLIDNPFNADGGYIPGRAGGGFVRVGEYGPELLNPRTGYMLPHSQTAARGAGGGIVVNVNVAEAADPLAVGMAVEKALLRLKNARGGLAFA